MQGKELLPQEELGVYLKELVLTKDPFLDMIAQDINNLTTNSTRPSELPSYLMPESFPLVITYDQSNKSTASVGILWLVKIKN